MRYTGKNNSESWLVSRYYETEQKQKDTFTHLRVLEHETHPNIPGDLKKMNTFKFAIARNG